MGVRLWQEDGKPKATKVPKCLKDGQIQNAKVTDPSTWMPFQAAQQLVSTGQLDGAGFVMQQDDGLVIIDLDKCLDPATEELEDWAKTLIAKFPTYTEISQSGTGLHLVMWGKKPAKGVKTAEVEIYSDKRFIWMTGNVFPGTTTKVADCQAALDELLASLQPADTAADPADLTTCRPTQFSDEQVLARMKKARNGKKLLNLYETGHWEAAGYKSQSEADLALCGGLYFWAEGDINAVDHIFRQSKLMRSKWDEQHGADTYGVMNLKKCVGGQVHAPSVKEKSAIGIMLDLINDSECEVFKGANGEGYLSAEVDGRQVTYALEQGGAKKLLQRLFFESEGKPIKGKDLQEVLHLLAAKAEFGTAHYPVGLRVMRHEGKIFIALGNEQWQVIEVNQEGWQVKEAADVPVRFYRSPAMLPLPLPAPTDEGDIGQLAAFIHVDEQELRNVTAFCLSVLSGIHPYPILVIKGEHGTAKSTTTRMIRAITDPAKAGLRTLFRQEEDLYIYGQNAHLLAFDNISFLTADQSDAFCRMSTGSGFGRRKLYTNSDEQHFEMARPIILNGIPEVTDRADLADRVLRVELKPFQESDRIDEHTLWEGFNAASGVILSGLLNALSAALKNWDTTTLERKPRLLDFARLVTAAEAALPWEQGEFLASYMNQRHDLILSTLDDDVFAQELIRMVKHCQGREVSHTATDFRNLIIHQLQFIPYKCPMNGRGFSQYLNRHKPAFRAAGVEIISRLVGSGSDRRKIVATWIGPIEKKESSLTRLAI
ncbi:hypothetical protein BOO71_0012118 [Deinococcus marmoris]|uniref:NrS-1 polymerase-like HBD domain-containing protein n=1 Tax=Deinococcus marmoris TaxID=249408 RepID=A0A1U7NTT0_9DEIO|nr:hypothetical protein BOO71_0012118 [Deinococcus marmoris]